MPKQHKDKRAKTAPYRLLVLLLYGQHEWLYRNGPTVRIPITTMAQVLKTRPHKIRKTLETLKKWELLTYRWHTHMAVVMLKSPVNTTYHNEEDVIDV